MVVSNWATAGMWSVQYCASTNQWVTFFLLNTHYSNSRAHLYGSNIIFPLEPLIPTFVILEAATEVTSEKGGGACMRKGESLICMSAPLSRRREREWGRPAKGPWGRRERSSSAFQRFADWLPPALSQEPVEQAAHIPSSDCSWWNTHVPLSSQHLAHANSSDSSHSNVLRPTAACQT